jgi:hypothetical protein
VLEKLDRFLSRRWVQRLAAIAGIYAVGSFGVGVVLTVVSLLTPALDHSDVWGIVGVVLMVFGVLIFVVGWGDVRRLRREGSPAAVADGLRITGKGHKVEGNRHEGWFTTRGEGVRLLDDIGKVPFSKVCFRSETGDHRSRDFYEACVRADDLPQEIRLGKHRFRRHPPRIVVRDTTDAGILIEERDTGEQKVRIIGYVSPGVDDTAIERAPERPQSGELSDTDRRRTARETEQRMARTIRDPLLRALDESNRAAAQEPAPEPRRVLSPESRRRLEREHERGKDELHKIAVGRVEVLAAIGPMGHFTTEMKLKAISDGIQQWAAGLRKGLANAGYTDAAALVAGNASTASGHPTSGDYDRLRQFVEDRMTVIQELLSRNAK